MSDILSSPIADLDLPHKAVMGLLEAGIETIGDMAALCRKDLDQIPGVGNVTIRKLDTWLALHKAQIDALPSPSEEEVETFVGESQLVEAESEAVEAEEVPQVDEIAAVLEALDVALPEEEAAPLEEVAEAEELTPEGLGEKELSYLALPLSDPYSRLAYVEGFDKIGAKHVLDLVSCSAEDRKEHFTPRQLAAIAGRFAIQGVAFGMELSSDTVEKVLGRIA
jgi:hypothetical protein